MPKTTLRVILTILMYVGAVVFLFPYLQGRVSLGIVFLIAGAGLTVLCGFLRCFLTEGDCADRPVSKPSP